MIQSNPNRLIHEKSPYLRQHAYNPVDWRPWNDETLAEAKRVNKPILLSVGYSTCHWCHVMEKESFENEDVAKILNRAFISIKVDREELPNVDSIYMEALQGMTGSGGWPMNMFLTPDRKPFFGGTYFPRARFIQLLAAVEETWRETPDRVIQKGEELTQWLAEQQPETLSAQMSEDTLKQFYQDESSAFDPLHGGKQGAPKFPPAYETRMLLRIHRRTGDSGALMMAETTLEQMARGGIYDHLGGGFHRYSVDDHWLVPHFEKMLYDQAALAGAYLEAYQVTSDPEYALVLQEILDYVLRDLTSSTGGFYSAEDADSEGVEGKFYVWSPEELQKILSSAEYSEFSRAFGITSEGNFEHPGWNILSLQSEFSRHNRTDLLRSAMMKLKSVRDRRIRPYRDEKVLTAWNGLMIASMARAGRALENTRYLERAGKAADFLLKEVRLPSGGLARRWIDGEAKFEATLEDYAFLIDALIELYQATFEKRWIEEASRLQEEQDRLFVDKKFGGYFSSRADDPHLLRRLKEYYDNVVPSGNSVSTLNLLRLSDLLLKPEYREAALRIFSSAPKYVTRAPHAFSILMMALDYVLDRSKEIAVIGNPRDNETQVMIQSLTKPFHPNQVLTCGVSENLPLLKGKPQISGRATAYVCERGACKLPTTDPIEAVRLAQEFKNYSL